MLGHEAYDKQPVKAQTPAESEYPKAPSELTSHNETATATPRHTTIPLKQTVPSRSPTVTPPALQQMTINTPQISLANMTKEEKAAEINRRKEERKQVSRVVLTSSRLCDK